jgi:hypothetical protein
MVFILAKTFEGRRSCAGLYVDGRIILNGT